MHFRWRRLLLPVLLGLALVLIPMGSALADSCSTTADGDWGADIWSCGPGASRPAEGDDVLIQHTVTLTGPVTVRHLEIDIAGVLFSDANLKLSGSLTINGSFDPGTYAVHFISTNLAQAINGTGDLSFNDLYVANRHDLSGAWVTLEELIEVAGTVTISPTGALDILSGNMGYAGTVNPMINLGRLRVSHFMDGRFVTQSRSFPDFNVAGYRGADLTTDELLGDVAVVIQGNASDCTESVPVNYAARCYTITPSETGVLTTTVRLWALTSELNGIPQADLAAYRFIDLTGWVKLPNRVVGNDGGSYAYGEGTTTEFSSFLLGDTAESPTAVQFVSLTARPSGARVPITPVLALGALTIFSAWLHRRRASAS